MSSDMRTALLDALGRYDVPPGPERVNFTIAFAAGWNAAANPEARADSAVPSSHVSELVAAAQAMVERWETPLWKDAPHTSEFVYRLRDAREAVCAELSPTPVPDGTTERLPLEIGDPRDEDDWYYLKRDALQWANALREILPLHFMDCNVLDDLEAFLRRVAAPSMSTTSQPDGSLPSGSGASGEAVRRPDGGTKRVGGE